MTVATRLRRLFAGPLLTRRRLADVIDLDHPSVALDPFPHYEALRASGQVHYLPHHQAWIVIGRAELQSVFIRPDVFSTRPYEDVDAVLLAADPDAHTTMRRIVSPFFGRGVIESLAAFSAEHAAVLLAPRLDIVHDYAEPLSEAVAQRLLGCDDTTVSAIRAAARQAGSFVEFTVALDALADRTAMHGALRSEGLGDAQARSLVRLFWIASTKTAERTIAQAVVQLLRHPDVRAAVLADDALLAPYIEEVMRLHQPEPMLRRLCTETAVVGGSTIPAGATVLLCLAAANRDPRVYEAPTEVRLDRTVPYHLTFGHGIHHCIGAALGRAEVAAAVRALLRHAPHFRAAQPIDHIPHIGTMMAHHISHFMIDTGLGAPEDVRS